MTGVQTCALPICFPVTILQEIETLNAKEETQREKKDSVNRLKLKDTIKLEILTPAQKQVKATEEVKDLMTSMFKRFQKRKKMDWFSVYMNAYTEVFDPHTNYFSPQDKEDFDVNFVGKVIGIGATIQESKGKIKIGTLVVGAPAWKSKQISEGDEILKVQSKKGEEPINVTGMLVDEAVRFTFRIYPYFHTYLTSRIWYSIPFRYISY